MSIRDEECTCNRCGLTLVDNRDWKTMTKAERKTAKADGKIRAARRDMCVNCREWLRNHGQLHLHTRQTRRVGDDAPAVGWNRCRRCGHQRTVLDGLCQDCADVTLDLNERGQWVS